MSKYARRFMNSFFSLFQRIRDSKRFEVFIILIIIAAGILVGMQTYPSVVKSHGKLLSFLDTFILWIFVCEACIKILAEAFRPWRYFQNPWNIFDFTIVVVLFLPLNASFVSVLRLFRVFRVFKLVTALPKLQIIVGALLKSIPSMGYVSLLLCLHFYMYAVMATFTFGPNDPMHFGNLQISLLSLFRTVTLEDWTDLMYTQMYGCDVYGYQGYEEACVAPMAYPILSPFFFVSFVMFGSMIILNLFVGVILSGMDEMQKEANENFSKGFEGENIETEMMQFLMRLEKVSDQAHLLKEKIKLKK